jgi:hypothetical protein
LRKIIAAGDPNDPAPPAVVELLARIDRLTDEQKGRDHETRFELWRHGRPFACVRDNPVELIRDPAWPEGDYMIRVFCSCNSDSGQSRAWGTLSTYGYGVGIVRGPDGYRWSSDGPDRQT